MSVVVGENPETSFKWTLVHFALHLEINVELSVFIADMMGEVQRWQLSPRAVPASAVPASPAWAPPAPWGETPLHREPVRQPDPYCALSAGVRVGQGDFLVEFSFYSPPHTLRKIRLWQPSEQGPACRLWARLRFCLRPSGLVYLRMRPSDVMMCLRLSHECSCASSGQQTFPPDPNRLSRSPFGLELSYLINVGCSSNHRNYLKGFQKRENKSNQTVAVPHSGAKCIFSMWVLFRASSQFHLLLQ